MNEIRKRYYIIDNIRAITIVSMVIYHLCYDIFVFFGVDANFIGYLPVVIWERSICCSFIILSGISLNLSSNAFRRGIMVNLWGCVVTLVTVLFLPDGDIWFGILNCIGCGMMITHILKNRLDRLSPLPGMAGSLACFALLYGVPDGFIGIFSMRLFNLPQLLYRFNYLAFLGFPSAGFSSLDYFPLLPWIFLYIFGYYLWHYEAKNKKSPYPDGKGVRIQDRSSFFYNNMPVLSFIGRHSLTIYLLHQPILYAICYAVFRSL